MLFPFKTLAVGGLGLISKLRAKILPKFFFIYLEPIKDYREKNSNIA